MFRNRARHLVELLNWRGQRQSGRTAFAFQADDRSESTWTYGDLDRRARSVAVALLSHAVVGDRALLLCPAGMEFASAIFGCFYAGLVPVPAYPPGNSRQIPRIEAILRDAHTDLIVTTSRTRDRIDKWLKAERRHGQFRFLCVDDVPAEEADLWRMPDLESGSLAFLQYTSGSTSEPKGVMVSHGNLLSNLRMIEKSMSLNEESSIASWLPMFHDMGLVGNVLEPLYLGAKTALMSPQAFVQEPVRWLEMITRFRSDTTGAPNFGYGLCVDNVSEEQRQGLDLSSLKVAYCGSEPIDHRVMDRFAEIYRDCGFNRGAFYPCYGMAEATLLVTGSVAGAGARCLSLDARALGTGHAAPAEGQGEESRLVGCGYSASGQDLRIVDAQTRRAVPDRSIGEVWVRGPNVALGYWRNAELTGELFEARLADTGEGPFLRTGDLAFLDEGNLFVTGRMKDVIIIRGRNYHPQDIERTAAAGNPALQPSGGAAFSVVGVGGEERLVVVHEVRRSAVRDLAPEPVAGAIREAVFGEHELALDAVVLLKPATLPRTSSGKVRRAACRAAFLDGSLHELYSWSRSKSEVRMDKAKHPSMRILSSERPTDGNGRGAHDSTARADEVIAWLREYAESRIDSRLIDERRMIPPYVVLDFGNHGLLGLQAPLEAGGLALSHFDMYRAFEQLAAIDLTLGTFVGLQNALGLRPLLRWGSPEQLKLLPELASGRVLASFGYTEPAAGSNPGAIEATATPNGRGGWTLRGSKKWIGTAAWSGYVHVFAQVLDDRGRHCGITAFTIRQGTPGFVQGPEELTMGMRGMIQNTIYLNDVEVGPGDVLGGLGLGRDIAQDVMEFGRTVISACALGVMKRSAQLMIRYGRSRTISTGRLLDNLVSRERLGQITVEAKALETLVYSFGEWRDAGLDVPREFFPAIKFLAAETGYKAVDHLMQMLGGRGYIETNMVPQMLRDARVMRIFEGPSETMQMFVGNRLAVENPPFSAFLREHLGSPELALQIEQAAGELKARAAQSPSDAWRDGQRVAMLLGDLGQWALWLAVVGHAGRRQRPDLGPAESWLRTRYEASLAEVQRASPGEDRLLRAEEIERIVADYAGQIGDVEQYRPSVLDELDPLLRRDGKATRAKAVAVTAPRIQPSEPAPVAAGESVERQAIEQWLQRWIAQRLGQELSAVGVTKPFADLGLDSLTAVELAHHLQTSLGVTVAPTATWDYPNIQALAQSLAGEGLAVGSVISLEVKEESPADMIDSLDGLSEGEMAALLAGELGNRNPVSTS
jgi:acyl-CoA synthetase (AMP-forming)/AMP-acid ligase II/alkylation response protein AidB-like acyl-CoA dehydrogenase/acyl carrier protein